MARKPNRKPKQQQVQQPSWEAIIDRLVGLEGLAAHYQEVRRRVAQERDIFAFTDEDRTWLRRHGVAWEGNR
jgi:hypothetical protein